MRTRVTIIVALLLAVLLAYGKDKKQHLISTGRWREVVRMLPDSTVTMFRDTMFLRFFAKDSFSYHHKNGFVYEGRYGVSEDSILDLGTVRYEVLESKKDRLVFFNDKGIYHFAIDSTDTVQTIVLKKQDSALPVTNIEVMIGRWTVYKRSASGPMVLDASTNIRSAYITGPSTDGKLGYIYSGADADNAPSWYIKEYGGGQSLNCDGRTPRTLKVERCQDGELILEEGDIKFYLKQLK